MSARTTGIVSAIPWLAVSLFLAGPVFGQTNAEEIAKDAAGKIQTGEFEPAGKLLESAVRQFPKSAELWNLLGIADSELHRSASAKTAFEHGLGIAPDSVSLNENIGFLCYKEANYDLAKRYLSRAIALGSRKPGVRFSLASARLRTGERAEGLAELKALEEPLANYSDYWRERGMAELPDDAAAAEECLARALQISPRDLAALNGAASVAEQQGMNEKALSFLIRARNVSPDDTPTLIHFGMVCLRLDLGLDAVDALRRARSLDGSNNSALYVLARANISLQNWQRAHDLFTEFAKRVPSFAPTYYAMGWLDIRLSRVADARKELQHCLSLAPELSDARYELAKLDLDDGQLDTAESLFQIVLKQNPSHPEANLAMGDLMMRKGKLDEAQSFLEAVVRANPKLAAAHYKLAMLYFRKREMEQGKKEKSVAAALTAEANRASKTQLKLVLPEVATSRNLPQTAQ